MRTARHSILGAGKTPDWAGRAACFVRVWMCRGNCERALRRRTCLGDRWRPLSNPKPFCYLAAIRANSAARGSTSTSEEARWQDVDFSKGNLSGRKLEMNGAASTRIKAFGLAVGVRTKSMTVRFAACDAGVFSAHSDNSQQKKQLCENCQCVSNVPP
jgi:hypothetical protein